ncbi:MAG: ADP-ribosylglycohydrolase family protein [Acidimicrobiales bacterium]|nr:ADP-ribosylglycohydrolase family protein [Acidimicrobiales bacterium]
MTSPDRDDRVRGCLAAGAVGDALGAPVEFWAIDEIRARLGADGVTDLIEDPPAVTDDTQLTLFTAEGLVRAAIRYQDKGICHPASVVHHAYLRWLHTQGVSWDTAGRRFGSDAPDGWLVGEGRLRRRRAPGNTCLSALSSGDAGTLDAPINDSKGCGGVMRVAPVGLMFDDPERSFRTGCELAAITHGHPCAWLPAGVLAATVTHLVAGDTVDDSVAAGRRLLDRRPGAADTAAIETAAAETAAALDAAIRLAGDGLPAPEQLEHLGSAWVGEEALAIAVCCALATTDARAALLAAVNHSGDSDSTAAICGNLVGAAYGSDAVPSGWLRALDVGDVVEQVADDLCVAHRYGRGGTRPPDDWFARYPGW